MDLLSTKINSSPAQFAQHLKSQGPIFWSNPEQFWVITDHELATSILKSNDFSADRSSFFMSQMSGCPFQKVANFFGVVKKMMVTSDAPEHTARRKLAASGVQDHILDSFQPRVQEVVENLLQNIQTEKTIDFVSKVALPLPNIVLADLFSIPTEQRESFYTWANHMTQFFGGGSSDIIRDAENADFGAASLRSYFAKLIHERRSETKNDFISHMLREQNSMEDDEVISQAAIMLVAGTITTTDQICNNLFALLTSNTWENLVENPSKLEAAIEEATRLDPAVNFIFRVAKKDTLLSGALIKAGQLVFVSSHAANRSENLFTNPDDFSLTREKNPHLSFGSGIHYCLGARLGRIQMKELFGQLLKRFPKLSLSNENPPIKKHQSLGFSGFETMTISLQTKTILEFV